MADDVKTGIRVVVEGKEKFSTDLGDVAEALVNAGDAAEETEGKLNDTNDATKKLAEDGPKSATTFATEMEAKLLTVSDVLMDLIALALEVSATLIAITNEVAEEGDAIAKSAQKIDFSTQAYQEWDYVLKKSGSSMDKAQTGITKLATAISTGDKKASEALDSLGLSLESLQGMSTEQQLATVVNALQQVEDLGTRNDLASALFGSGGAKALGTLLSSSSEEMDALIQQAHDFGVILSDETIDASQNYMDSLEDMQNAIKGVKNTLADELMPVIQPVRENLTALITEIDWATFGEALGIALGPMMDFLNKFIIPLAGVALKGVVATLQLILNIMGKLGEAAQSTSQWGEIGLGEGKSVEEYAQAMAAAGEALAQAQEDFDAVAIDPDATSEQINAASNLLNQRTIEYEVARKEFEAAKKAAEDTVSASSTSTSEAPAADPAEIATEVEAAEARVETAGHQMIQTFDEAAGEISTSFVEGTDEMSQAAADSIIAANDAMATNMATLNGNAYLWGMDMMRMLANGILDGAATYVTAAADSVAAEIAARLHHSEPDVGPLSDDNDWMPDMMRMFAQGIRDGRGLIASAIGESFDLGPMIAAQSGGMRALNYGGVNVTIYGAEGQSVDELYDVFSYRLARDVADREAVFST